MDVERPSTIEDITVTQHGLVTRDQLRGLGLSEGQIKRILRSGRLRKIRRAVYGVAGSPDSWDRGLLAAILSAGDDAVASHASAAKLWSFKYAPEPCYELTVPRSQIIEIKGVRIHRSRHLDPVDVLSRDGIRRTTYERT